MINNANNVNNPEPLTKCKKCGKINHSKCNCANNICHICLSKEHTKKDCPIFHRCNRCFNVGHLSQDCPAINEPKCEYCKIACHKKEDCLKHPKKITLNDIQNAKAKCEFCGSEEHLICPYSQKENYIILYDYDYDKDIKVENDMNKNDFSSKIYWLFLIMKYL